METRRTALIDFGGLYRRLWHGSEGQEVSTARTRLLAEVARISSMYDVVVCLDSPPYWRRDIYPEYKANREALPEVIKEEMHKAIDAILNDGHAVASYTRMEADDVIAALYCLNGDAVIYATDKDLLQVADLIEPFSDKPITLESKFPGVKREQLSEFLALIGDTSDNIKGVDGLGPKKGAALLDKYKTIEAIYDDVDANPGSFSASGLTALLEARERVKINRQITIVETQFDPKIEKRERKVVNVEKAEIIETPMAAESKSIEVAKQPEVERRIIKHEAVDHRHGLEPVGMSEAWKVATALFQSRLYQNFNNAESIFAVIMRGRDLGLCATASLDSINMIKGKPTMSAQLLSAVVMASPKCEYLQLVESTPEVAIWETKRHGNPRETRRSFTIQEAEKMGLTEKDNWKKQPAVMLQWRACAAICRAVYPDLILGVYTTEELEEVR